MMQAGMRWLFVAHRYLGIGLCLLMLMWCLSGIVMMYVPFPRVVEGQRLAGLTPLNWQKYGDFPASVGSEPFSVEMMHGRLLLHGRDTPLDLSTGGSIDRLTQADALAVARDFAQGNKINSGEIASETIQYDQWTVTGDFRRERPLYRVSLNDAADTILYVSSRSGRIVQQTHASQRFWNYLGAVPHWLYFTEFRTQQPLWLLVVIYSSLAGSILVATGLYIGIRQWLAARRAKRWSPYRGFLWWHHVPGLVFGLFLLSWVFSGLLSMNPWGLLESNAESPEIALLSGVLPPSSTINDAITALAVRQDGNVVQLETALLNDRLFLVLVKSDGTRERLDASARPAALTEEERNFIARTLTGERGNQPVLLPAGDDYYFSHGYDIAQLPVWRLINREGDRYYFDPLSGGMIVKFASADRGYRWLFQGLHRFDFTPVFRAHPARDIWMVFLLCGASLLSGTGVWLALRYLTRKIRP